MEVVSVNTEPECVICGYNLRGLPRDGVCPECGTKVERSLHGNLLAFADRDWLLAIERGARLLGCAIAAPMLAFLLIMLFSLIFFWRPVLPPPFALVHHILLVITAAVAVAGICALPIALLLFTRPEPRDDGAEKGVALRDLVRASGAVTCGAIIWRYYALPNVAPLAAQSLAYIGAVAVLIGCFLLMRQFVVRIPRQEVADTLLRRSRAVGSVFAVALLCDVLSKTLPLVPSAPASLASAASAIGHLAQFALVWGILSGLSAFHNAALAIRHARLTRDWPLVGEEKSHQSSTVAGTTRDF